MSTSKEKNLFKYKLEEYNEKIEHIETFKRRIIRIKKEIEKSSKGEKVKESFFEHNEKNNKKMSLIIEDIENNLKVFDEMSSEDKIENINNVFKLFQPYLSSPGYIILDEYKFIITIINNKAINMSKTYNHKTSNYTVEDAFYNLYTHGNGEAISEYEKELYDEYWTPFEDVPIKELTTKELKAYREKLLLSCELKKVNDIFSVLDGGCSHLIYYNMISELSVPSIFDYYNEYDYYKSKTFNIKTKTKFENFIDRFIDTEIDVKLVKFDEIHGNIKYRCKKLNNKEYKTLENLNSSGQIIEYMMKNYDNIICFQTVSNMLKYDFFSDITEVQKELFLKKISWFMCAMYDIEENTSEEANFDDTGSIKKMIFDFKESIEKQYLQKMDKWDIII